MNDREAAANLEVIRTLMERSALYRRALGPVMLFAGLCGILGAALGPALPIHSARAFVLYWAAICALAWVGILLLVRRQALKDGEPLWSPPARRVIRAFLPAAVAGAAFGLAGGQAAASAGLLLVVPAWILLFGVGMLAAGFFLPRGVHWFGLAMLLLGGLLMPLFAGLDTGLFRSPIQVAHALMGLVFGLLLGGFGACLWVAEMRKPAP